MVSKGQALKASNCGCISLLEGSTLPTKLADVENVLLSSFKHRMIKIPTFAICSDCRDQCKV